GAHLIFHGQGADDLTVADDVEDSGAALGPRPNLLIEHAGSRQIELPEHVGPADEDLRAIDGGLNTAAGGGTEIGAAQFELGGLGGIGDRGHAGHGMRAFGQGAGFVEEHHVDGAHAFQSHPVLDQDSGFRGPFSGDRDDQRDRQAQGVWAGDDQHGHGTDDRLVGAADQGPDDGGDDTGGQGEPEQEGGGPIGQRLGTRGGVLS